MFLRSMIFVLFTAFYASAVLGDTLTMKDGSSLVGRVIEQGDNYWIKDADGRSQLVDKSHVASWIKGGGDAPPLFNDNPSSPASRTVAGSGSFASVKLKADHCYTAIAAAGLWQAFIDAHPSPTDLVAAKQELKRWQEITDGNGENINGKWVWGEDRENLIKKVTELLVEARQDFDSNQMLNGIAKLESAVKLYPNNFEANFELGLVNLVKGYNGGRNNAKLDLGIKSLETAVKVQPQSAPALSDLAIGYALRQKYELSIMTAYQAAKIEDSKEVVQNLVMSIYVAPPGMRKNSKVKPVVEETLLLAGKYGISGEVGWIWVRPKAPAQGAAVAGGAPDAEPDLTNGPPGIFANGTGFFISPDGYILTNKHVAKPGDYLMVKLADGSERLAERIIVDDDADMAVIKIKVPAREPFIRLASYDHPPIGADVAVFGFPLLSKFGLRSSVKMTRGIVTAWDRGNVLCDVTVDAAVNPGNSGGPMVDHRGNLLALTAMKTYSSASENSYGLGYSTARIREFFKRQGTRLLAARLAPAMDDGPILDNVELATKLTPATVCILICRGTPPTAGPAPVAAPPEN